MELFKNSMHGNYKQTITLDNRVIAKGIHAVDRDSEGFFGWAGKNSSFRILRPDVDEISFSVYCDVPSLVRISVNGQKRTFTVSRKRRRIGISFKKADVPVIEIDMFNPLGWLPMAWNLDWRDLGMKIYDISYRSDGREFINNINYVPEIRCTERKKEPLMTGMYNEIMRLLEFRKAVDTDPEKRLEIDLDNDHVNIIYPLITALSLESNIVIRTKEEKPGKSKGAPHVPWSVKRRLKILVATSDDSMSDVKGGNQMLAEKLVESINTFTRHNAVLYLLPFKTEGVLDLVKPYMSAFRKDAGDYDAVISIKYPSFCINHPCHISLLNHRFKAFYSLWKDSFGEMSIEGKAISPVIRKFIHIVDNHYLKKRRIIAQSKTIQKRLRRHGLKAEVEYPPPMTDKVKPGKYEYFLLPGRHDDRPKRISMAIEAMRHFRGETRLVITGGGRDTEKLKKLAGDDKRIEFTGYVDEQRMKALYSNALAVIFTPFDEDYGLVTVEAFKSRKPVITCSDSGGPTEFVSNLVNGFVVSPDEKAIARCMEYLAENPSEARRMGLNGLELVNDITWEKYSSKVCSEIEKMMREKSISVKLGKDAEEDFILNILTGKNPNIPANIDWKRFLGIARYHSIPQYLINYGRFPENVRNDLQKIILKQRFISREFMKACDDIRNSFSRESVDYLLLKGINNLLEGDLERKLSDLDIMISEKDLKRIRNIMEDLGFRYTEDTFREKRSHEYVFVKDGKMRVELKTKLDSHIPLSLEEIQTSANKKEIMFCFDVHHALFDHHFRSIRWLYQISQKLKGNDIDITKSEKVSKELGMEKTFRTGLALMGLLFGAESGTEDLKALKKARFILDMHNMVSPMDNDEDYLHDRTMRILLSENRYEKIMHIKNAFLTPKCEMAPEDRNNALRDWKSHLKNKNLWKSVIRTALV